MQNNILIFIPTYNEAENVKIIYKLLKSIPFKGKFDILFLDDNSLDGTGEIIDQISVEDPSVYAIHRNTILLADENLPQKVANQDASKTDKRQSHFF
jgi:glycosyltransferase involved in cell wall biosynthesis